MFDFILYFFLIKTKNHNGLNNLKRNLIKINIMFIFKKDYIVIKFALALPTENIVIFLKISPYFLHELLPIIKNKIQ